VGIGARNKKKKKMKKKRAETPHRNRNHLKSCRTHKTLKGQFCCHAEKKGGKLPFAGAFPWQELGVN